VKNYNGEWEVLQMKRLSTFLVCLLLTFSLTTSNIFALAGGPDGSAGFDGSGDNEDYYQAVAKMVQSYWSDDYFSQATLNIQDATLEIDNRIIQLSEAISEEYDELMLSEEVLSVLGVQVQKNAGGVSVSKNGRTVELTYGENSMIVNGGEEGMGAAPVMENGASLIPESVLTEEGLGFEVNKSADQIVITNDFQTMRIITRIKPGAALPDGLHTEQMIAGPDNLYILQFSSADEARAACEKLNASTSVVYAEPDGIINIAEALPAAEAMPLAGYDHWGWGSKRIGADTYVDYLIESGKQYAAVTVGILDTGLDMGHLDLEGRWVDGYNFVAGNNNPSDDNGHGTHVSGTVIDVTMAMPNIKVMPLKVADYTGSCAAINIASGIRWAVDKGVNVLNASISGVHYPVIDEAIDYAISKNVTVVAAAGNKSSDAKFACPAHLGAVITVTSITRLDNIASNTNFGASVDVAAPGVDIVSTYYGGGTTSKSGTSMASPHAAGAAALLLCNNPKLKPADIQKILRENTDKVKPEFDLYYGYGILNIGNALPKAPDAPRDLTATPGNGQITLSWLAPLNDGGSEITGYQVSIDDGSSWISANSAWIDIHHESGYSFTGLTNGITYTFKVRALNAVEAGAEATVEATPAESITEPSVPRDFTATPGDGQIRLSWAAPANDGGSEITAYQVWSSKDSTWVNASSHTGHTITGLINGEIYDFKVQALNAAGYSDTASITAIPATVPSAPQNFTAIPGNGQVALSWTAPASNGGSAITAYQVSSNNGSTWVNASTNTGHTFSGLNNGTTYTFKVRARNTIGAGNEASTTATPFSPYPESTHPYAHNLNIDSPGNLQTYTHPGAAASLRVTFSSETNVDLRYDMIHIRGAGGVNIPGSPFTGTMLAGTTVLVPGNTFEIYITSDPSMNYYGYRITNIETDTKTIPSQPQNFTANPGNKQVTLSWTVPASNGGSAITIYQVSSNNGSTWVNASSNTGHTFSGLTNGIPYTFKVRAHNALGAGEEVATTATPAAALTVPGQPRNFIATPGNGQVTLSWIAPASDGGSAITGYEVWSSKDSTWVNASSSTGHTFNGLTNGLPYNFKVRALNAVGAGAEAATTATPLTVPGQPRNFTATPGNGQVTLSWTAPESNGGSAITGYQVWSSKDSAWVNASSSTGHTFNGLTNGLPYTFKVRARNSAGDGAEAMTTATPVAPLTVPGQPQNFTATPGNGQVTLSWTAPASNGGSAITGYQVWSSKDSAWVNASSNTGHTFSGLTNGLPYNFKVRALNAVGAGAEAATIATPEAPLTVPGQPQNFTAAPGNGQVTLSWTAPASNGGSAITGYQVSSNNGSTWVNASSNTGHTFSGLTNGLPYNFKVRALNAVGAGAEAATTATPEAPEAPLTVPGQPQNFTATPGNGQVTLSWIAPASDGGSAITGYQVWSSKDSAWVNASSNTGHTFSGLTNGIKYDFKVRALNAVGAGAEAVTTATPAAPVLTYPESTHPYAHKLTIDSPGNLQTYTYPGVAASLKVTFSSDTKVENNYDKIYITDANGINITGSPFTYTALAGKTVFVPGNTVKIYITSDGSTNYYGYRVTNIEADTVIAPSAPQYFTATPGNGQVALSWTAPASDGGSAITAYQVWSSNNSTWVNASSNSGHTFNGLNNGTLYTFKVRAQNNVGYGDEDSITAMPEASQFPESTHPYANNLDIDSPGNLQIYTYPGAAASLRVTFSSDTKVENSYDKIYITDANGVNIPGSPFTSTSLAGATVTVPGNTVKIYIISDGSINYYGYKVMNIEAGAK